MSEERDEMRRDTVAGAFDKSSSVKRQSSDTVIKLPTQQQITNKIHVTQIATDSSHLLSLISCWTFLLPQHVENDIFRHVCILLQSCNSDTRDDVKKVYDGLSQFLNRRGISLLFKYFSILQFLGNSLHGFLGRPFFSIPILHTIWFYLFESDLPIDLLVVLDIVEIRIPDWSPEKQNRNFSFSNFLLPLLSRLLTIFVEPSSLLRSRLLGDFLCLSANAQCFFQQGLGPKSRQFPGSLIDSTHDLVTVSRGLEVRTVERTLLAAVLLLLNASECGKPSGSIGDHGSVVLVPENVVVVKAMGRWVHCVHAADGFITCGLGWVGHSARPTPANGCARADSATPRHGRWGCWTSGSWRGWRRQHTWERTAKNVEQRHQITSWRWNAHLFWAFFLFRLQILAPLVFSKLVSALLLLQ